MVFSSFAPFGSSVRSKVPWSFRARSKTWRRSCFDAQSSIHFSRESHMCSTAPHLTHVNEGGGGGVELACERGWGGGGGGMRESRVWGRDSLTEVGDLHLASCHPGPTLSRCSGQQPGQL